MTQRLGKPAPVRDDTAGELVVTWEQYHRLIEHLALQLHLAQLGFDQIVALSRGGLRVGDLLSRLFDKPLVVMAAVPHPDPLPHRGEGNAINRERDFQGVRVAKIKPRRGGIK